MDEELEEGKSILDEDCFFAVELDGTPIGSGVKNALPDVRMTEKQRLHYAKTMEKIHREKRRRRTRKKRKVTTDLLGAYVGIGEEEQSYKSLQVSKIPEMLHRKFVASCRLAGISTRKAVMTLMDNLIQSVEAKYQINLKVIVEAEEFEKEIYEERNYE